MLFYPLTLSPMSENSSTARVIVQASPLHGEGVFADADFKTGDMIMTHWDAAFGRCPPTWKVNSSVVMERPTSGIKPDDLKRLVVTYKVQAARAANVTVCKTGVLAARDLVRGEELLYAYCPLHWLVEYYIDDEPSLATKLDLFRVLQSEWKHQDPNSVPLHQMNFRRLGVSSWDDVAKRIAEDPGLKISTRWKA